MSRGWVSDYLVQAFKSPNPALDGRTVTIVEVLDRDVKELQDKFVDDPPTKATLLLEMGLAYASLGLVDRSLPLLEQVVQLRIRYLGAEDPATMLAKQDLARTYWVLGRTEQALPLGQEVLKYRQKILGLDHPETLGAHLAIANYYFGLGRKVEGLDLMERTYKVLKAKLGTDNIELSWPTTSLADLYRSVNRLDEALALDEPLLKLRREKLGLDHPETIHSMRAVAQDYVELGRLDDAAALLRDTVKLSITRLGADHSQTVWAKDKLAEVLRRQGKPTEAQQILTGPPGIDLTTGVELRLDILLRDGHFHEASSELRRAVRLQPTNSYLADAIFKLVDESAKAGESSKSGKLYPELIGLLAELKPDKATVWRRRGELFGRFGQWEACISDLTRAITLQPDEHETWHLLAPVLVEARRHEIYRKHCRDSLERFAATRNPLAAERISKDCLILPSSGVDLERVSQMTDVALQAGPSHWAFHSFEFCKGFAQYRLGHYEAAVEWMGKVLAAPGDWTRDVEACLVLAMAEFKLGKKDSARNSLARGSELQHVHKPQAEEGDLGPFWTDWLIVHALEQEARALIQGNSPDGGSETKPSISDLPDARTDSSQ